MLLKHDDSLPLPSELLAWAEFLERTGVTRARVTELVELGWLTAYRASESLMFRQMDVYKTRKLDRLCDDFEIPALAGAIIVDLLDRIEDLEKRLNERPF